MTDRPDIERLLALAEAASEGPWEWWTSNSWRRLKAKMARHSKDVLTPYIAPDDHPDCKVSDPDAAFIAAARTALPEVCTYALALEARIAELEAAARKVCDIHTDLEEFDGDRRGIAASFESAMERLEALLANPDPETAA